jgi:hypothetical protein
VKRHLLFLCVVAVFCVAALGSGNILTIASAQQAGGELSLAPLLVPNNGSITRIRSMSNDGQRVVWESDSNYAGGNPNGNREI